MNATKHPWLRRPASSTKVSLTKPQEHVLRFDVVDASLARFSGCRTGCSLKISSPFERPESDRLESWSCSMTTKNFSEPVDSVSECSSCSSVCMMVWQSSSVVTSIILNAGYAFNDQGQWVGGEDEGNTLHQISVCEASSWVLSGIVEASTVWPYYFLSALTAP